METHTLREAGENGGYVRLASKPVSWPSEGCGDAARHTGSTWRQEMNKRSLGLCILKYERGLRNNAGEDTNRAIVCRVWTRFSKAYR